MNTDKIPSITTTTSTAGSLSTMSLVLGYAPTALEKPAGKPSVEIAPPDHPIYNLVGRVASGSARLEHALDLIIWQLSDTSHEQAACITGQMIGATPRYRAIYSLLKYFNDDALSKLADKADELMKKTYDLAEERNRIVHDPWYVTDAEATAQFRAMPSKDPRFGIYEIDSTKCTTLLETIERRILQIEELEKSIKAELDS